MLQWLDFLMEHLELVDETLQLMRQCVYLTLRVCIQHGIHMYIKIGPFCSNPFSRHGAACFHTISESHGRLLGVGVAELMAVYCVTWHGTSDGVAELKTTKCIRFLCSSLACESRSRAWKHIYTWLTKPFKLESFFGLHGLRSMFLDAIFSLVDPMAPKCFLSISSNSCIPGMARNCDSSDSNQILGYCS